MRISRLMQVESSFARSASTDSSQMATSSSDDCIYFYIKSLRLMGSVTFLDLVQSQSTCVELTCSPCAMNLNFFGFFLSICSRRLQQSGCVCCTTFAPCKRLCVGCMTFYVRIRLVRARRLVHTNTSFESKADFAYMYDLCALSGSCIRIRICA